MNFYQILLSQKTGFNRNLTWYENLFAKFYNSAFGRLLAKFLKIKGNTVKFNQLVQNGNFVNNTDIQTKGSNTNFTVSNNIATFEPINPSVTGNRYINFQPININTSHKTLFTFEYMYKEIPPQSAYFALKSNGFSNYRIYALTERPSGWGKKSMFIDFGGVVAQGETNFGFTFDLVPSVSLKNVMIFDLTLMGIDNLTTVEQVEDWLSNNIGLLPYYAYTPGTLIPFKGTGLKTVGKNLFDISSATQYRDVITNGTIAVSESARHYASDYIKVFPSSTYHISSIGDWTGIGIAFYDGDKNFLSFISGQAIVGNSNNFVSPQKAVYMRVTVLDADTAQIELGSTATAYEPYTSSTLSLPTLTYFSTGMKEAGGVYDELTESKAITRVGSVDLGTLTWYSNLSNTPGGNWRCSSADIQSLIKKPNDNDTVANVLCPKYLSLTAVETYFETIGISVDTTGTLFVYDTDFNTQTSAEAFKQAMSGVMLYYELETPTSQDISLDLSYEIEWGGTEQLLPENTSTPTTSAILADMHYPDG